MKKIDNKIIELCEKKYFEKKLAVPMGKINEIEPIYLDFENVSGLFITGATGTGKSVLIDLLICGLMCKNNFTDISFCLIDPKEIELSEYNGSDYVINGKNIYDIVEIVEELKRIDEIIKKRIDLLLENRFKSIVQYNKQNDQNKWNHIFVVIDEGYDIYNKDSCRMILENILNVGKNVGIHLIFATNSYLKQYADDRFIDRFKYRMSFDLASVEQSKFLGIKNSSWLKGTGEALIKGTNGKVYKFQAKNVTDEEIHEVVLMAKI